MFGQSHWCTRVQNSKTAIRFCTSIIMTINCNTNIVQGLTAVNLLTTFVVYYVLECALSCTGWGVLSDFRQFTVPFVQNVVRYMSPLHNTRDVCCIRTHAISKHNTKSMLNTRGRGTVHTSVLGVLQIILVPFEIFWKSQIVRVLRRLPFEPGSRIRPFTDVGLYVFHNVRITDVRNRLFVHYAFTATCGGRFSKLNNIKL